MKIKKLNNKGFSLVELICSVAILGIVIVPLLHSFVTSSNLTSKSVKQSEATLAGKNVLEAVASCNVDDFFNGFTDDTKMKNLFGDNAMVSPMVDSLGTKTYKINGEDTAIQMGSQLDPITGKIIKDPEGNFSAAVQNVRAGNSEYDAVVRFTRGYEPDNSTNHFYEINSDKIKLAQFDNMDGSFCQPYEIGQNPDLNIEDEMKARALNYGVGNPETSLVSKARQINIIVDQPAPVLNDETGKYEYQIVQCKAEYIYTFTYDGNYFPMANNPLRKTNSQTIKKSYTIFPGGYLPKNKDGSISIYFMYYPLFKSSKYTTDTIRVFNNSMSILDGHELDWEYYDERTDTPYYVPLNTYLYKQKPYEYVVTNPVTGEGSYQNTTHNDPVKETIALAMPKDFDLSETDFKTYIYTNAKEAHVSGGVMTDFDYMIGDGISGWASFQGEDLENNMVRKEDKIKICNISVTLYPVGSITEENGIKSLKDDASPVYTISGTR